MVLPDCNLRTFHSRVDPGTAPRVVKRGDRVRVRLANLSMDNHPIHFHGHRAVIVGTDAGPIEPAAQWPAVTVDVPPGSTRDVEFVADNPGDWPLHCHKNHHAMNAMSHDVPNMLGVDQSATEQTIHNLIPGYMSMGSAGMHEHTEHSGMAHMKLPFNTLPMMTGKGQFGAIGMGGMFTVIKIREGISGYADPGD